MPWNVKKVGNKWAIVKSDTGKIVGHSTSKAKASASVRARYAGSKGEVLSEIQNMADFVRKVVLVQDLNAIELEELVIDGQTYSLVPDSICPLSGSIAAAFGVKKKDDKMWVPKDRLEELVALGDELAQEMETEVLFDIR